MRTHIFVLTVFLITALNVPLSNVYAYETSRVEIGNDVVISFSTLPVREGGFICDHERYSESAPVIVTLRTYHLSDITSRGIHIKEKMERYKMATRQVLDEDEEDHVIPVKGFFKKTGILDMQGVKMQLTVNSPYDILVRMPADTE